LIIRPARPGDEAEIHAMIGELAAYERAPQEVTSRPEDLTVALFGPQPQVFAHVAVADEGEPPVGFALWYVTYSTWTGRHGLWVEDLYVRPSARRSGIGGALLACLADECTRRGYRRLEWWVLDWNTPALRFYQSLGATPMAEWTVHRIDNGALERLARGHVVDESA
jgi:GNAT superfamily N-acetyltransferase